jgi:D-xylose transport system substrate-binding protein
MDQIKKVAVLLMGFLALLLNLGCLKSKLEVGSTSQKKIKLGFILATMNEERYSRDKSYFTDFASAQAAEVEFASCDGKVDLQTAKVETMLSKKVDAIVIQPVNGEAASSVVALAKKDNVPVVAYDRLIKNADIDAYVTQNSFQVGVLQAEAAVEATHGKGNYVVLMGEAGHSVADEITKGVLSVLDKHPEIKVVVKQSHPNWSSALALATVENALTRYKNDIQAVLANNDGMALGAVQALDEQKLTGKVFVAGADADLTAIKNILKNKQSMTVLKGIKPLAEEAVKVALALAKKEPLKFDEKKNNGMKEVPVINTPVVKINKDNIQSQIVDTGFQTKEAVFNETKS